jgi:membrane protein YdbS with pleckstrin-like domain
MIDAVRNALLQVLRIPAQPTPPSGASDSIRIFQAARNFYYLNLIRWAIGQSLTLAGVIFVFGLGFFVDLGPAVAPFRLVEAVVLAGFLLQLPVSYLFVRFDYELRWYIVTDRSLRIRHGLMNVREMTMTFANIQQISIHQGPLQRLLGIADLQVRTAGGGTGPTAGHASQGGAAHSGHLGYFRGVSNASEIRDLMLDRLRRWRDTGLGDPDEAPHPHDRVERDSAASDDLLAAARTVLTEAQALRKATS